MALHDWNGNGSSNDHFDNFMDMKLSESSGKSYSNYRTNTLADKVASAVIVAGLIFLFCFPVLLLPLVVIIVVVAVTGSKPSPKSKSVITVKKVESDEASNPSSSGNKTGVTVFPDGYSLEPGRTVKGNPYEMK